MSTMTETQPMQTIAEAEAAAVPARRRLFGAGWGKHSLQYKFEELKRSFAELAKGLADAKDKLDEEHFSHAKEVRGLEKERNDARRQLAALKAVSGQQVTEIQRLRAENQYLRNITGADPDNLANQVTQYAPPMQRIMNGSENAPTQPTPSPFIVRQSSPAAPLRMAAPVPPMPQYAPHTGVGGGGETTAEMRAVGDQMTRAFQTVQHLGGSPYVYNQPPQQASA